MREEILKRLYENRDEKYADFQRKLIPTVSPERIIGVRTPALRAFAKELAKRDCGEFLCALPHEYFEENQLHALVISQIKDADLCFAETERFVPYIDNWATCDQLKPKACAKSPERLLDRIRCWLSAEETYTVRFGVDMLMTYFLDENFFEESPALAAAISSEEYYVNMARAWYFATALAKHYDAVLPYITERRLDKWTHNKSIQKAIESYRITDEQKAFLKTLRIK